MSSRKRNIFFRITLSLIGGALLSVFYVWLYVGVLGLELPKTIFLRGKNARWSSRVAVMNASMDATEEVLDGLEVRDERIYRSLFGMNEIPSQVREAGIWGEDRYAAYDGATPDLQALARRLDRLTKMAYIQSVSYDEVESVSKRADEMASSIPAIPPMNTDKRTYHMSSPFGYRSDPLTGWSKMHSGMDFACDIGNPVHATGDGVVTVADEEYYGYGNCIMVDHGFGYVTRYAHLNSIDVAVGDKVRRGDLIGYSGKSGRITGPHLHYEVIYRGEVINPADYMDLDISPEDYKKLVNDRPKAGEGNGK